MALSNPGAAILDLSNTRDTLKDQSPTKLLFFLLEALKPEIFQRRTRKPLKPTSWLDGLRGWAAFAVVCLHLGVYTHADIEHCYGSKMVDGSYLTSPAAWPFLRIFFSGGHFAVMLFFTISGYVICMRLLSLLHEGRTTEFIEALNSAVVRRPLRLYLPVVWSTLSLVFIWHVLGVVTPWPPKQINLFWELVSWARETGKFGDFYRMGFLFTYYNIHTWTIPVELRGSMFLFVWLFAFHQVDNRVRVLLQAVMVLYLSVGSSAAWYACFFAGMMTAELDMLASAGSSLQMKLPWDGILKALKKRRILRWILLHAMLVAGFYLGGQPSSDNPVQAEVLGTCYGWKTLSNLIPLAYHDDEHGSWRWFWLFWAAWLVVLSVKEIPWARAIFESRFSQYLGKHSFAMYLIHGPMIGIVGERLFYLSGFKQLAPLDEDARANFGHLVNRWHDASWWPFPDGGPYGLEPNFLFCQVICVIIFLYVAEMSTKMFDLPSVRVARWAYSKIKKTR